MSGNNTFGEAISGELLKMKDSPERSSFILMKRIHPIVYRNYPLAVDKPVELTEMVSELGIYGSLVAYVALACLLQLVLLLFCDRHSSLLLRYSLYKLKEVHE